MAIFEKTNITVTTQIKASVSKVWEKWNNPDDIKNWCHASDDWHAPHAENDLEINGKFSTTMAAKDGSMSFDFSGKYSCIKHLELIEYILDDERKVSITFSEDDAETTITETFEAENSNPLEMQKAGWQAILDNFKKYVEHH